MKRIIAVTAMLSLVLAGAALADQVTETGPGHTLGSGGNSLWQGGSWEEAFIQSGNTFVEVDENGLTTGNAADWPGLEIDLWVERECYANWTGFQVEAVRTGDYTDFCVTFPGFTACNIPVYIVTTSPLGTADLNNLKHDNGTDLIPIDWEYRVHGQGEAWSTWADMNPCADGYRFSIPACDHWLEIRACLDLAYHQPGGHYHLGDSDYTSGYSICPVEPL